MGGGVGFRSAVRSGGSEGVGFGWRQRWGQLGRQSQSRQRLLVSARASDSGTAVGEGIKVGDIAIKGISVGDNIGGAVTCVVGDRGGAVTYVVGSSKGVGGVELAA